MKVCHVVEAAGGGSGQVVVDLIRDGIERGDEITLVFAPDRADPRFLADIAELEGSITVHRVAMRRDVGWHDFRAVGNLAKVLHDSGPFDVINSHSSKAGALTRIAGLRQRSAAQVYTPHAFATLEPGTSRWYGRIERILSTLTDRIIVVSEPELEHARNDLHIPPSKLRLVHNGIGPHEASRQASRTAMGVSEDHYVVGFIGRLVDVKNPRRLAQSFELFAQQNRQAVLAVVGDGPALEFLEAWAQQSGLSDRVRFLGQARGRDFAPGFDALLLTSDSESFGLVLVEAMAAGVPVVSTPVGVSGALIEDGRNGYRSSFDPHDIAADLKRLADLGPSARQQVALNCLDSAALFSVEAMTARTHAVYGEAMDRRTAS